MKSKPEVIDALKRCKMREWSCDECSYFPLGDHCWDALHSDLLFLLNKSDFENADEYGFIPVWCEVMSNISDPFVIKDYWNCIPIDALETAKEDGYRYWTAKPSLKQMEETPWP